MTKSVLILGGSGRFGRHATQAFKAGGWTVHHFNRGRDNLNDAAKFCDVIINGWNPAYPEWHREVPRLTKQVIRAAKSSGATVMLPGNVYVFGKDAPEAFGPRTPQTAKNSLGQIRRDMEAAYRSSGVQTIILRAGDFIDTDASGNRFDQVITAKLVKGRFIYPGRTDIPHAWAYLPDVAKAAVGLAEMRNELGIFEDVPFGGYTLSGAELFAHVRRAVPQPLKMSKMNWLPLYGLVPFWKMARRLLEMRYLWNKPHHLDGARLTALLPDFTATDPSIAIALAVKSQINPDQAVVGQAAVA